MAVIGWLGRQQQEAFNYLRTENEVLREKLGKKRIVLNDDQRRRLAVKGKVLGRKRLTEIGSIFSPDTILRWHRQLIANKWDYSERTKKEPGRPRVRQVIVDLTLKMARENPGWSCDRIQGALSNLGYHISDTTVENILKRNGIERAPKRQRSGSWESFLKTHWDVLASIDFTTVEVWNPRGLVTYYLLFVMELKSRRVQFAGCTPNPTEQWMAQQARELTAFDDGFLLDKQFLLMDRDPKFRRGFRELLRQSRVKSIRLPSRSPNMNAHVERFFGSLKRDCLDHLILFGESSLRNAAREYVAHYHAERNHQGLNNRRIEEPPEEDSKSDDVIEEVRLGGLLRHYRRAAA